MTSSIEQLQHKRQALLDELNTIDAFRRGTISVNYRKCGKPTCVCAAPDAPGHGPQYLWNATIDRKSYAKNLRLGPEAEKYINETEHYRAFQQWCESFIDVNEHLCDALPIKEISQEQELDALKKKLRKYLLRKRNKK